ncbi:hypothetical protein FMZ60_08575 [Alcaligenaceae bacterium SJ-26]|nr:hypothetical protein FMZ60_08575 [Alcaligenaceae bacterium SJ-26]
MVNRVVLLLLAEHQQQLSHAHGTAQAKTRRINENDMRRTRLQVDMGLMACLSAFELGNGLDG